MIGKSGWDISKVWKTLVAVAAISAAVSASFAADLRPIFGTNEQARFDDALRYLNMTERDTGFDKDVGKPELVLQRMKDLLHEPLDLPNLGDRILAEVATNEPGRVWRLSCDMLELVAAQEVATESSPPKDLPQELDQPLKSFLAAASRADSLLLLAFGKLSGGERRDLAAEFFAGTYSAEDRASVREDLLTIGLASQDVKRAIAEGLEIDPAPAASNQLAAIRKVGLPELLEAGRVFQEAAYDLAEAALKVTEWPKSITTIGTPLGAITIGTEGSDLFTNSCLLVLDPGGDDVYRGGAGSANGLKDRSLSAVIDLGGDDRYGGDEVLDAGAALFGVSVLLDRSGDDVYRAEYTGQAAALFGVAWLEDRAGDDTYRAQAHAQGAAFVGLGYLRDDSGSDSYNVGFAGQAYAGVQGVGLLVDEAGNDRYYAGGLEPDYERNDDRYISLAQGFAIGMRPFAGGGVAALVDRAGNDRYEADVYGQGVGYWYSAGLLLDVSGNDTYTVYQYGQGAGIHLSLGLLADGGGKDFYNGYILVQGSAHDYGVGMLFDQGGDDTYTGDHHAQGRALNNAMALLVDSAGDDAYFGRQPDECQGVGNNGDRREYGSLAVLMDLAGTDRFTCGATNGCRMLRPDFGIVYDAEESK